MMRSRAELPGAVFHITDTLDGEWVGEKVGGSGGLIVTVILLQAHEEIFHALGIKTGSR